MNRIVLLVLLWPLAIGSADARRATPEPVALARNGNRVDVAIAGRPFTTFYFDPSVAKPYFFPLRSAAGTIVTRGFPATSEIAGEDRDEPHQRPMYFAHGDINGFDFWGEAAFPKWSDHAASTFGRTRFKELNDIHGGSDSGGFQATFDLVTPAGTIAEEVQTYRFAGDEQARSIDCEFTIRATHGPIAIGDTKEGTFAIRVVKALKSPPGHMVNADGRSGERGIWGKRSPWVDYAGRVAGEDVGIAIFDHAQNPRPAYWHARAYGLFAANPFGVRQFTGDRRQDGTYPIAAGQSLTLRYGVLIHHGTTQAAAIADAYRRFVEHE